MSKKLDISVKVSVIIVNYFASEHVKNIVREIINNTSDDDINFKIFIIDNSVSGNELNKLQQINKTHKDHADIIIVVNKKNVGYSKGNNIGLRLSRDEGFDFFLILNPDISNLSNHFIKSFLVSYYEDDKTTLIGPEVYNPYIKKNQGPILRPKSVLGSYIFNLPEFLPSVSRLTQEKRYVFSIVGCCIFGKIKRFEEVGFFDENVFLYNEEIIVGEKLKISGQNIAYDPKIKVFHLHKREFKGFHSELMYKMILFKSTVYTYRKYFNKSIVSIFIFSILYWISTIVKILAKVLKYR